MNKKGITLIALIITVIVLLILAGTAISITLNSGDIFTKATTARDEWNTRVSEENSILNQYMKYIEVGEIIITTSQNGAIVELTYEGLDIKTLEEATENEKLDALLELPGFNGMTREDLKIEFQDMICSYEEAIEYEIDGYSISISESASESDKLDAILAAWKANNVAPSEWTREDVKNILKSYSTYEGVISNYLKFYNITEITEKPEVTVKLGNNVIPIDKKTFIASQEGTYKIVATGDNKKGEATLTVDYGGLTPLVIESDTILYDSSTITTWQQLIDSEYNTLNLEVVYDPYFADPYFVGTSDGMCIIRSGQ